jgi:hypothetical protein
MQQMHWTPDQVADLDTGQVMEFARQMGLDAQIEELRGRVAKGEISPEAFAAGAAMIIEEG